MKNAQVVFTQKEKAALLYADFDPHPGPGEIVGENIISLISTGSERGGFTQQFSKNAYPMHTGSSSIGRVMAVGEGVTAFNKDDLFYHNEHHDRYVKLKAEDCLHVPEGAKPEKLIFGRYAAVSMTSIFKMQAKPVDTILVTGQGMVGIMCAAVMQCFGFRVLAVDPSAERRDIARQVGIVHVGESLKALEAEVHCAGALMECSGNEQALYDAIPFLRYGAQVFQIGVPWHKTSEWDAHDLLYQVFYGFISIHGGWEWQIPRKSDEFHAHSSYSHIEMAMGLIAQGKITIPECMYELRDPRDCDRVYREITIPRMRPTSMILDWRKYKED